jgi:hypothetical protein
MPLFLSESPMVMKREGRKYSPLDIFLQRYRIIRKIHLSVASLNGPKSDGRFQERILLVQNQG